MKRVLTAALVAAAVVSASAAEWVINDDVVAGSEQASQAASADVEGTWSGRVRTQEKADGTREPRLQLQMNLDDDRNWSNWGQSFPLTAFTSLPANLDNTQDVAFELRRDAGVIRFTGRFEGGRGVGHLFFTASRDFERAIEQQTRDTFTDRELFSFAVMDVSRAFVKELQDFGYRDVTLEDARKARIHGVTMDFLKEMRAANLGRDLDDMVQMRIHGVTPAYAREMRELAGQSFDADQLRQMRIHGVTAAYVKEMRAAGFNESLDALKQARIHGVTPAFAKDMAALGYTKLAFDDLRTFRIHGVSAAFVREMAALGYKNLDADTLVRFRIHGVTPSFVKELKAAGHDNLSEDELVDWAIHGRRLLKHRRK